MKKFRFTLQAVLTLRQRAEQTALENYSRALLAREGALKRLGAVEAELSVAWDLWRTQLAEGCPAAQAAQTKDYCGLVEQRKKKCEQDLQQTEREFNAASKAMIEARQQREVVENLESAQREHYDRELRIEERKEIEDLINRGVPAATSWKMSNHWN